MLGETKKPRDRERGRSRRFKQEIQNDLQDFLQLSSRLCVFHRSPLVTTKHKKILSAEVSHGKLFIDLDMP